MAGVICQVWGKSCKFQGLASAIPNYLIASSTVDAPPQLSAIALLGGDRSGANGQVSGAAVHCRAGSRRLQTVLGGKLTDALRIPTASLPLLTFANVDSKPVSQRSDVVHHLPDALDRSPSR